MIIINFLNNFNIFYAQSLLLRTGAGHTLVGGGHGVGLYYSPLPPIELPEMPPQAHASPLQVPQLGLHHINIYGQPITDAQVAHARLYKQGHPRPLGRTQSAPLPLGHPRLTGAAGPAGVPGLNQVTGPQLYDQPDVNHDGIDLHRTMLGDVNQIRSSIFHADRQVYDQRNLLQKIRQTVLTRSGREPQLKEEETSEVFIFLYLSLNSYSLLIEILGKLLNNNFMVMNDIHDSMNPPTMSVQNLINFA